MSSQKDIGNGLFAKGDFLGAIGAWTVGIVQTPTDHILYSNRSGGYLAMRNTASAIADARECVRLAPRWGKGHSRLGAALAAAGKHTEAAAAFAAGISVDPTNTSLSQGLVAAQAAAAAEEAALAASLAKATVGKPGDAPAAAAPPPAAASGGGDDNSTESKAVIGIDLGTTYSCVAVWLDDQGRAEVFANSEGALTTASVVAFTDTERLIGQPAQSQAASNAANTVFDAKRLIGRSIKDATVVDDMKKFPFTVVAGADGESPLIEVVYRGETRRFAPEEVSAMVLVKMKQTAELALGKTVKKAVITVPAYFNDSQRNATKNAGAIAGLQVLRIVNEPTAAALAYGLDKKAAEAAAAAAGGGDAYEEDAEVESIRKKTGTKGAKGGKKTGVGSSSSSGGGYVLIFDLGGGTFDVSLLTIADGIFEVKATGGDTHLGGEDFDSNIQDWALTEFKKKYKSELAAMAGETFADGKSKGDPANDKRSMRRLRTACERAKRTLSTATQATLEVDSWHEGIDLNLVLTRAKFEQLNEKFFTRCIDTVKACLRDAKASPADVGDVVLVGGSTRIPKVQAMLSDFFGGKELCKSVNPDEAVAVGAAVQGAILSGARSAATQSLVLVDVTPLSLGIETEGKIMSVVIKRNTPIPVRKTKTFTTMGDFQTEVDVDVYEGERATTEGNNHLGHFVINDIERAKRGVPQVDMTFDLDANGILTVTAMDQVTKATANITISNTVGHLSKDEIEKMLESAEKMKKEDEALLARLEARNQLEQSIYYAREAATARDSGRIMAAANEAKDWLEDAMGDDAIEPKDFKRKQAELDATVAMREPKDLRDTI